MPEPTLHPNLAKIAAAYDDIIERSARKQLAPSQARAEIAQLEARDDDGVRWSIDPDSGQWVRKTAFGDAEYDPAPPASGYRTFDAFDLGNPNATAFNPADRLTFQAVPDQPLHPGSLLGATRRPAPTPQDRPAVLAKLASAPRATTIAAAALALIIAALAWAGASGNDAPGRTPAPTVPTQVLLPEPAPAG